MPKCFGVAGKFRSGCFERGVKFDLSERFFLVGEDGVSQTRQFDVQLSRRKRGLLEHGPHHNLKKSA
jgi:hypothetical protein